MSGWRMMTAAALALALATIAAPAAAQQAPVYSDWYWVQSDKALQVRTALLSVEGEVASMRYQFRLERNDDIFCRHSDCRGYIMAAYDFDPYTRETANQFSVYFPNEFNGVWTYPVVVKTLMKTFPNGDRSYWDPRIGPTYVPGGGGDPTRRVLIVGCVDNQLASSDRNRCDDFDRAKMIDLTGVRGAMETVDIPPSNVAAGAIAPVDAAGEAPAEATTAAPAIEAPVDVEVPDPVVDPQAGASLDLNAQAAAAARAQSERIAADRAAAAAARVKYATDQAAFDAAQARYAADQAEYQRQLQAADEARAAYERRYPRPRQ